MQTQIDDRTILRAPATVVERPHGAPIAIDPASPHWIATDERGLSILRRFDGRTPLGDVVRSYAVEAGVDMTRAWLHVETFARDALRDGFISTDGAVPLPYLGRAAYLRTDRLRELWIQVNDYATYLGPMKATVDEEGHFFPRGMPVEVCTDTAAKLRAAPYSGSFAVVDGLDSKTDATADDGCCGPGGTCC
jgi:hypothetical protein